MLNLEKNDILDLTKKNPGLVKVNLAAGWDISKGLFSKSFDLDIAALMVEYNGKVKSSKDVIYFGNKQNNGIKLHGDNLTGAGDGDDETISLDLSMIDSRIQKIIFVVTIFKGEEKRQTFGKVKNSYVRLLDVAKEYKELCRFNLESDGSSATAVKFAELMRDDNEWQFKAVGEGLNTDLKGILDIYK